MAKREVPDSPGTGWDAGQGSAGWGRLGGETGETRHRRRCARSRAGTRAARSEQRRPSLFLCCFATRIGFPSLSDFPCSGQLSPFLPAQRLLLFQPAGPSSFPFPSPSSAHQLPSTPAYASPSAALLPCSVFFPPSLTFPYLPPHPQSSTMFLSAAVQTKVYTWERIVVLVSCTLSFLGAGLLVGTHALWPELRTRPRQLLLYLSLADLFSAASYFYGVLKDFEGSSLDCVAQGAISTFANTSSFFWTMAIALYLYITIVQGSLGGTGLLCFFHVVSWGIPLVITVSAVILNKIGYDASDVSVGWCWINIEAEDRVLWMLLAGKVWEILAYITLPIFYILIKKHINRAHAALSEYRPILSSTPTVQARTTVADKKLALIPVIFISLRIWSTVRFILTLCGSPTVENPLLVVLHGIGNTFQGGANCILFVLCTRVVRRKLFSCLCCWQYDSLDSSVPGLQTNFQDEALSSKDWEAEEGGQIRAQFPST
uniref:G protein-coupled receptor 157 n=1 Tax=Salvator merianae TaxID=96440 RepID=A0A8D0BT79_SALMN